MNNSTAPLFVLDNFSLNPYANLPSEEYVVALAIEHVKNDVLLNTTYLYGAVILLSCLIVWNNWQTLNQKHIPFWSKKHISLFWLDYTIVILILFASKFALNGIEGWLFF